MSAMGFAKGDYLAGMWRVDLTVDLLWRVTGTGTRPSTCRAPSWSWASVDGEIYFHSSKVRQRARENLCSKLLEAHITPVQDQLGQVQDGHIILQSPLLKSKISGLTTTSPDNFSLDKLHINNESYDAGSGFEEIIDHNNLYAQWPTNGKEVYFGSFMSTTEETSRDEYTSEVLIMERNGNLK